MPSQKSARLKESIPLLWRNRFCWLPFIGALVTLIPTLLVILNLWEGLPKQLAFSEILYLDEIPFLAADLDARTFYFLSLLLLAVSAIVAITVAGYIIFRFFKLRLVWAVLVPMAIIFLFVPKIRTLVPTKDFYEPIFWQTEKTIAEAEGKNGYSDPTFLIKTKPTADIVNKLVVLGILMVVAAFAASLHTPENMESVSVEVVAPQRKKLLLALYSGSGLLIFGVVATYAAVRIPSVFLSALSSDSVLPRDSAQYAQSARYMKEVALMITTTFGVTFTLSLAGAYFPASIVITERAKSLAAHFGKAQPDFDTQKWLEEQKLATSPFQRLTRGVAVLAPFLVSFSQLVANLF